MSVILDNHEFISNESYPVGNSTVHENYRDTESIIRSILKGYSDFKSLPNWEPTVKAQEIYLSLYRILAHQRLAPEIEIAILSDSRIRAIRSDLHFIMGTLECKYEDAYALKVIAANTSNEGMTGILLRARS